MSVWNTICVADDGRHREPPTSGTVMRPPTRSSEVGRSGRGRRNPARPASPAITPIATAVMANAAAGWYWNGGGMTYDHRMLPRPPVSAPAIGPHRTPTKMVPMESR